MNETISRQWRLAVRPTGGIQGEEFEWCEAALPATADGQLRVRTVYLSLDPTNRIWMSDIDQYMAPVEVGEVMRGGTIGVVEESRLDGIAPGAVVQGMWGWQSHAVIDGRAVRVLPADRKAPLTAYMSVLGSTGCTAYFGLLDIGKPQPGETVVVSAAAGAVGSIVGQIAKIEGCRVVGIAGSAEKCAWITDELGFDAAINYREEDVLESLRRHCPDGIDVDFENVGGATLDAVLTLINLKARVVVCGLISQYNDDRPGHGPTMFRNVLMKRARVEGFIVTDFLRRFPEAIEQLGHWLADGRLKYRVDVVDGLEAAPAAVTRLFDGTNTGKLMVKVSEEPA